MKRNMWITKEEIDKIDQLDDTHELVFDNSFGWRNRINNSTCMLKVYRRFNHQVAIVKEISSNAGMSVTNGAEGLWRGIEKRFGCINIKLETYDEITYDRVCTGINKRTGQERFYWEKYHTRER